MNLKIVIGTANKHKFEEIEKILRPSELNVELIFGGDIVPKKPDETGKDFYENALLKAKYYSQRSGLPALSDDSGLMVDVLNGAPGIFSARYAGEKCNYDDNNRKLLTMLDNIPENNRTAKFVCTAVLYLPDSRNFVATGVLEGKIAKIPRGTGGFGYDPVFELPDGRTVAEIPQEFKNQISHRAKAFLQMRGIIAVIFNSAQTIKKL